MKNLAAVSAIILKGLLNEHGSDLYFGGNRGNWRLFCVLDLAAVGTVTIGGIVGAVSLVIFGLLLTRAEVAFAGRAYAAYGGVYIAASLLWLLVMEGVVPDRWDIIGAGICLVGAALILWGPRPFIH